MLLSAAGLAGGCTLVPMAPAPPLPPPLPQPAAPPPVIQQASLEVPACPAAPDALPFASLTVLSAEAVVVEVLARNPSLAQMVAAWQAATARYPQAVALEDPMVAGIIGPASIGSNEVDFAYRLEASQKLPFPGKRGLRGRAALAEASAAGGDVDDMRLQLAESARAAFYDYYLAERALAVNAEGLRLLREFRENAETRYRTALVPQQDVLQADVEIGRQRERELTLRRLRQVARARINTLMHLPPDAPLPPPPEQLPIDQDLPDPAALRAQALASRPDLRAVADRLEAEEAAVALARKEFYPDTELMAAYDAFWQPMERDLRPMLGMRLNLPVYKARRWAAVAEAQARVAQRRAELAQRSDQVQYQVQEAYEQVRESASAAQLYETTILPAAEANVKAAQAAYTTGKVPFLSLVEAQRNVVELRDRYYEVIADYYRRRAALERAVGALPDGPVVTK